MIGQSGQLVQSHVTLEKKRELGDLSETEDVKVQAINPGHAQVLHADVCHQMVTTYPRPNKDFHFMLFTFYTTCLL